MFCRKVIKNAEEIKHKEVLKIEEILQKND